MSDEQTTDNKDVEQQSKPNDELGEKGIKALQAEREARQQAEKDAAAREQELFAMREKLQQFEDAQRTDEEKREHALNEAREQNLKLQKQLEELNHRNMVMRVAAEAELPSDLVDRLRGETEDELREDAKSLKKLVAPKTSGKFSRVPEAGDDHTKKKRDPSAVFADAFDTAF